MEVQTFDPSLDHVLLHALCKGPDGAYRTDMDDMALNQALDLGCLQARLGVSGALKGSPVDIEIEESDEQQPDGLVGEVLFN